MLDNGKAKLFFENVHFQRKLFSGAKRGPHCRLAKCTGTVFDSV